MSYRKLCIDNQRNKENILKIGNNFFYFKLLYTYICSAVEMGCLSAVRWILILSAAFFLYMHLLYLDDAGSVSNKSEEYVILGGVSIFETTAYYLTQELDKLAESYDAKNPSSIEFHASEIFSRRSYPWKTLSKEEAQGVIKAVLKILANANNSTLAFACAVHKDSFKSNDALQLAFEDLCQRFDIYLSKMNAEGERQKGLLILDDSSYETTLQELSRNFRKSGTQWGNVKHLADTPFFVNSKASRIIQMADHVAYAVFRRYNAKDTQYFDIIASKFYQSENVVHGLAHKQKIDPSCMCAACFSRRVGKDSSFTPPLL